MKLWKRRLTVLVAVVGSAGMLMSSAQAREPRDRPAPEPPTLPVDFTFPTFPTVPTIPPPTMPPSTTTPPPTMPPSTTTPPPTMPPSTLPADVHDQIQDVIDQLQQYGDEFQALIDFLSNPFGL